MLLSGSGVPSSGGSAVPVSGGLTSVNPDRGTSHKSTCILLISYCNCIYY